MSSPLFGDIVGLINNSYGLPIAMLAGMMCVTVNVYFDPNIEITFIYCAYRIVINDNDIINVITESVFFALLIH